MDSHTMQAVLIGTVQWSPGTYCVPDLQLYLLAINVDHACTKLHADCEIMHWLKPLVCELQ